MGSGLSPPAAVLRHPGVSLRRDVSAVSKNKTSATVPTSETSIESYLSRMEYAIANYPNLNKDGGVASQKRPRTQANKESARPSTDDGSKCVAEGDSQERSQEQLMWLLAPTNNIV